MPPHAPEPTGRRTLSSVEDVLAGMCAVLEPPPRADGVACFTRLYLEVTKSVQAELEGAGFADPRFLERLDLVFAGLFFDTLDASARGSRDVQAACTPLFDSRSRRAASPRSSSRSRGTPTSTATCRSLSRWSGPRRGSIPARGRRSTPTSSAWTRSWTGRAAGERRVPDGLAQRARPPPAQVRPHRRRPRDVGGPQSPRDGLGERHGALGHEGRPRLAEEYLRGLDRFVAFSSRGLLGPADTALSKVRRRLRRVQRDPLWWV